MNQPNSQQINQNNNQQINNSFESQCNQTNQILPYAGQMNTNTQPVFNQPMNQTDHMNIHSANQLNNYHSNNHPINPPIESQYSYQINPTLINPELMNRQWTNAQWMNAQPMYNHPINNQNQQVHDHVTSLNPSPNSQSSQSITNVPQTSRPVHVVDTVMVGVIGPHPASLGDGKKIAPTEGMAWTLRLTTLYPKDIIGCDLCTNTTFVSIVKYNEPLTSEARQKWRDSKDLKAHLVKTHPKALPPDQLASYAEAIKPTKYKRARVGHSTPVNQIDRIIEDINQNVNVSLACAFFCHRDNSDKKEQIVAAGGIEAIVCSMNRNSDENENSPDDQHYMYACQALCQALSTLASCAQNREKIAAAGGIQSIVKCMTRFIDNSNVLAHACQALNNIVHDSGTNRKELRTAGGIATIIEGMSNHPDTTHLQENACALLSSLAVDDRDSEDQIVVSGGIQAIIKGMDCQLEKQLERVKTKIQPHIRHACWALYHLVSDNADNRDKVGKAGGVKTIIKAMVNYSAFSEIQHCAFTTLGNICYNNQQNVREANNCDGIEAIVKGMVQHEHDPVVQEHACWALGILGQHDLVNRDKIGRVGGIKAIVNCLTQEHLLGKYHLQKCACVALSHLVVDSENAIRTVEGGGIQAIISAIKCYPTSDLPKIARLTLRALSNNNEQLQRSIRESMSSENLYYDY